MNSRLGPTIYARHLQRNAGPITYWLSYNWCLVKVMRLWHCFITNKSLNFNHDSKLSRLKQEPLHSRFECWHGPLQFYRSILAGKTSSRCAVPSFLFHLVYASTSVWAAWITYRFVTQSLITLSGAKARWVLCKWHWHSSSLRVVSAQGFQGKWKHWTGCDDTVISTVWGRPCSGLGS